MSSRKRSAPSDDSLGSTSTIKRRRTDESSEYDNDDVSYESDEELLPELRPLQRVPVTDLTLPDLAFPKIVQALSTYRSKTDAPIITHIYGESIKHIDFLTVDVLCGGVIAKKLQTLNNAGPVDIAKYVTLNTVMNGVDIMFQTITRAAARNVYSSLTTSQDTAIKAFSKIVVAAGAHFTRYTYQKMIAASDVTNICELLYKEIFRKLPQSLRRKKYRWSESYRVIILEAYPKLRILLKAIDDIPQCLVSMTANAIAHGNTTDICIKHRYYLDPLTSCFNEVPDLAYGFALFYLLLLDGILKSTNNPLKAKEELSTVCLTLFEQFEGDIKEKAVLSIVMAYMHFSIEKQLQTSSDLANLLGMLPIEIQTHVMQNFKNQAETFYNSIQSLYVKDKVSVQDITVMTFALQYRDRALQFAYDSDSIDIYNGLLKTRPIEELISVIDNSITKKEVQDKDKQLRYLANTLLAIQKREIDGPFNRNLFFEIPRDFSVYEHVVGHTITTAVERELYHVLKYLLRQKKILSRLSSYMQAALVKAIRAKDTRVITSMIQYDAITPAIVEGAVKSLQPIEKIDTKVCELLNTIQKVICTPETSDLWIYDLLQP